MNYPDVPPIKPDTLTEVISVDVVLLLLPPPKPPNPPLIIGIKARRRINGRTGIIHIGCVK
jgi:hypothetical protein